MIFGLFTLAVAIFISGVSAFYSVTGLTAIFAAAFWPIVIMGSALEVGKITATVWLHKYWHRANWQFKAYLIPAIIVLMIITSMGTYGYLAKAHMDQTVTVGDSAAQVAILDEKIKTEKDNIDVARKALQQMDAQVNETLARTKDATDNSAVNRSVTIRRQQAKERKALQLEITKAQQTIAQLQNERAPLAAQSRKIEAEVGPIKYIAALIYGDNPDANLLERAVRWVIILLVFVFDPLALVLILAAEQTIEWARNDRSRKKPEGWHQEWVPDTEAWPEWDDEISEEQYEAIRQAANVDDDIEMEQFFADGKELAKEIDANDGFIVKQHHNPVDVNPVDVTVEESILDKHPYLKKPWAWVPKKQEPELDIPVLENEETWSQRAIDEQEPIPNFALTESDADNVTTTAASSNAGFGTSFPSNPNKGDIFLRVDMLPNKPYKWNGNKWIEVEKTVVDRYVDDQEYIKYLTDKVKSGEYDFYDLSKVEQEEVLKHLDYKTRSDL